MKALFYPPKIPIGSGRRFAIGDIHGCYRTLVALLEQQLQVTQKDQLFFLGDYINKGKQNAKVLDYLIDLQENGYQSYYLRGNHEKSFLMAHDCDPDFLTAYLRKYGSSDLQNDYLFDYYRFCASTLYCAYSDDIFLSHCGQSTIHDPIVDLQGMFSEVTLILDHDVKTTRAVHGHYARDITQIEQAIQEQNAVINIDAGCVYANRSQFGYLCALDLTTWELVKQVNIE